MQASGRPNLTGVRRLLLVTALLALAGSACAEAASPGGPAASGGTPAPWAERDPVVYSVVVAEVLDDLGAAPGVVFVVDGVCPQAGQVDPGELSCSGSIPSDGKAALQAQLERYARVEFVDTAEAALGDDGAVREDGVLFWLGPLKDRKNGEVRVGANYARRLSGESLGVNLAMTDQGGSWIVTGAAGLGGCPA